MKQRKPKIFLPFYEQSMQAGRMQWQGLCGNFDGFYCDDGEDTLKLFKPTYEDKAELQKEGFDTLYWASGLDRDCTDYERAFAFTPLRQTITLLMAAINEEL